MYQSHGSYGKLVYFFATYLNISSFLKIGSFGKGGKPKQNELVVEPTHLNNTSQIGNLPQGLGVKLQIIETTTCIWTYFVVLFSWRFHKISRNKNIFETNTYPDSPIYGLFTYIYHIFWPNVGKYNIPYIEHLG